MSRFRARTFLASSSTVRCLPDRKKISMIRARLLLLFPPAATISLSIRRKRRSKGRDGLHIEYDFHFHYRDAFPERQAESVHRGLDLTDENCGVTFHKTMNFIYLSPHFPPNYYLFCVHLRRLGANVLGLADPPHDSLRPELREALCDYYRVDDLHNYDQLLRGCGYFTQRHGKLDRIDSHNEYWLETEARLRTDFNMYGLRQDRIAYVKRKSAMKEIFRSAGGRVARGAVVRTLAEARRLVAGS